MSRFNKLKLKIHDTIRDDSSKEFDEIIVLLEKNGDIVKREHDSGQNYTELITCVASKTPIDHQWVRVLGDVEELLKDEPSEGTLKVQVKGDLGWPWDRTKEIDSILDFINDTGFSVKSDHIPMCDCTNLFIEVDFEVPEETHAVRTLDDIKALFPHLVDDPIHEFFGLSYANYLVLQRSVMQSMPYKWQRTMVNLLNELDETIDWRRSGYVISREDDDGNEILDDLADYQRGRRKVAKIEETNS